ncbi:MAG: septum site-determining protein MinC [Synechococcales cyanobacterium CRU_2_2]|nr:septum site-determining protein MinC [Synechococcales cyanobacterium CRU_2_2]
MKRHDHHLGLVFPPEQTAANPEVMVDFVDSELWQQLQQRLSGGERFWEPGTSVHLNAQNHLLDSRQLQELGEALDRYDLKLTRIATSRRQTAVAAATAGFSIDQGSELPQLLTLSEDKTTGGKTLTAEPLYLQTTVRSGAEVRHPGSVIIMGDLNPGSSVVADGDILIWGRLRGVAHAGAAGNKGSIILALKLEPTQLRIADSLARVPQTAQGPTRPEVAYVTAKGDIRITEAAGFTRPYR